MGGLEDNATQEECVAWCESADDTTTTPTTETPTTAGPTIEYQVTVTASLTVGDDDDVDYVVSTSCKAFAQTMNINETLVSCQQIIETTTEAPTTDAPTT